MRGGVDKQIPEFLHVLVQGLESTCRQLRRSRRRKLGFPVGADGGLVFPGQQEVAGRQFKDAAEDGMRRKRAPVGEHLVQNWPSSSAPGPTGTAGRLDLRAEQQPLAGLRVEERAHAQAVPRQEQGLVPGIPDRDGELAIEPLQAIRPEFLVKVQDDLGVGVGGEPVAAAPPAPAAIPRS